MAIFSSTVLDKIPILREFEIIIFDPTVSFKFTLFKNKLLSTIKLPLNTFNFKLFWLLVDSKTNPVATGVSIPFDKDTTLFAVNEEFLLRTKLITLIVDSSGLFGTKLPLTSLNTNSLPLITSPINIPVAPDKGCVIVSPWK